MSDIEIGKACIVKERTKLEDRGSYVGVVVDKDDNMVYVMNDNGVFPTKEHCVITDPTLINKFYNELKEELARLKKIVKELLKSMEDAGNLFVRFCYKWDDYVKASIPSKERLEDLKKLTIVQETKKNLLSKYESQIYYIEDLMQDIEMHLK